jgi:MFS family permease
VTAPAVPAFGRSVPALLALSLAMAVGFTAMGSFGTVQEAAKAELGLSDYALSLVQGVSAAIPMVLLSVPIGILVDRANRVRLMILLALVWTAGTALTAAAPDANILFMARMLTAIGATGSLTAALSLGADLVVPEHRGRAALMTSLGKTIGVAGGFAVSGWLIGWFIGHGTTVFGLSPWRSTHAVLAVLSLALSLPLLLLREPPRHEIASAQARPPFRVVTAELWSRRRFLIPLFAGQVSVVMADNAAMVWAAPVLTRNHGLTPSEFAGWMGALILLTGLVGAVLGGIAADWGQKNGRRGGILIGAVIAAVAGVPAAVFPIIPDVTGFAVALGALMLGGTVTGLVVSVALTVLLPNELRGLCLGAFIAVAGLIGFGIAPTLVAAVSDWMGGERHLAEALALVGVVVSAASVAAFWQAMRTAPESAIAEPI